MRSDAAAVAERYDRFAREEAPGRSALYEEWAAGVADDPVTAGILARIEPTHRQPPLVFAVTRMLGAPGTGFATWSAWLADHADDVVAEASRRRLQTNEPQRCAALLPALSTIEGPIALLELGASAGLCLYPDRYSYRYRGGPSLDPATGPSRVVLTCDVSGDPPLRLPEVVWRAGIDLAPLNAADPGDRAFLTALVWPGETGRAERIEAALDVVAADPPALITGDASDPAVLDAAAARTPGVRRWSSRLPGCCRTSRARGASVCSQRCASSIPSGSRSTRRGCTTPGDPRSPPSRGAGSCSAGTGFRSQP
nr:hypothetical protein GCM10025699_36360 [Microbacterium flavescens]